MASQWVSVKDKYTPDNGRYLVYTQMKGKEPFITFGIFNIMVGWDVPDGPSYRKHITHWMPLPETPKA